MKRETKMRVIVVGATLSVMLYLAFSAVSVGVGNTIDNKRTITFSKDVAPIFNRNCVTCHRPGEIGPMSLITYSQVRPWARSIREKVVSREMPPWDADSPRGEFANDRSLSQEEIDTISAWVDQGAKGGDPKQMPPPPEPNTGWHIGKPDVVLTMPEEYTLGPDGPDQYIDFRIPTNFKEDVWVQALEVQPGNRSIVHHIAAIVEVPRTAAKKQPDTEKDYIFYRVNNLQRLKPEVSVYDDGCGTPAGGKGNWSDGTRKPEFSDSGLGASGYSIAIYTPGANPSVWPAGTAKRIPAGSTVILQVHYFASGKVERDRSRLGLLLAKEPPDQVISMGLLANHYFKIPPGAGSHEVTACATFQQDAHILSFSPHMHFRGKDMTVSAIYPDGQSKVLLSVRRYRFMWQTWYCFKNPLPIPKGTRLQVTAHFDNSAKNKFNPDPSGTVRWGEPTKDEMVVCFLEFTIDSQHLVKSNVTKAAN